MSFGDRRIHFSVRVSKNIRKARKGPYRSIREPAHGRHVGFEENEYGVEACQCRKLFWHCLVE